MTECSEKKIYIVVSQTGTILSRIIRLVTGAEYNHSSISLSPNLETMYSFGRRNAYNPFWAGFVVESLKWGTFKRFTETKATVIEITITPEQKKNIEETLETMSRDRDFYRYNYIGLFFAAFHIIYRAKRRYYCSEFVKEILQKNNVAGADQLQAIVHPVHFLSLPHRVVFTGKLREYAR